MLVLTRGKDESVRITGGDGKAIGSVKLVCIRGEKVRLGFTFPKEISVDREEVAVLKDAAKAGATT